MSELAKRVRQKYQKEVVEKQGEEEEKKGRRLMDLPNELLTKLLLYCDRRTLWRVWQANRRLRGTRHFVARGKLVSVFRVETLRELGCCHKGKEEIKKEEKEVGIKKEKGIRREEGNRKEGVKKREVEEKEVKKDCRCLSTYLGATALELGEGSGTLRRSGFTTDVRHEGNFCINTLAISDMYIMAVHFEELPDEISECTVHVYDRLTMALTKTIPSGDAYSMEVLCNGSVFALYRALFNISILDGTSLETLDEVDLYDWAATAIGVDADEIDPEALSASAWHLSRKGLLGFYFEHPSTDQQILLLYDTTTLLPLPHKVFANPWDFISMNGLCLCDKLAVVHLEGGRSSIDIGSSEGRREQGRRLNLSKHDVYPDGHIKSVSVVNNVAYLTFATCVLRVDLARLFLGGEEDEDGLVEPLNLAVDDGFEEMGNSRRSLARCDDKLFLVEGAGRRMRLRYTDDPGLRVEQWKRLDLRLTGEEESGEVFDEKFIAMLDSKGIVVQHDEFMLPVRNVYSFRFLEKDYLLEQE